jgi:glycosyltransferase involved in cell wall biosynthesis
MVAPVYNEEETLPLSFARVVVVMEHVREPLEIVFVNDASRDGS